MAKKRYYVKHYGMYWSLTERGYERFLEAGAKGKGFDLDAPEFEGRRIRSLPKGTRYIDTTDFWSKWFIEEIKYYRLMGAQSGTKAPINDPDYRMYEEEGGALELARDIRNFLEVYAIPSGDNPEEYNSPDAYCLLRAALLLEKGERPGPIHSEWGSGSYRPYTSEIGREWHQELLERVRNYEREKGYCCPDCNSPDLLYIGEAVMLLGDALYYGSTAWKCEDCGCVFYVDQDVE